MSNIITQTSLSGGGGGSITSVNGDTGPAVVLDTDNIAEGAINFYYTAARFNTAFAAKSTSDLTEGTNLYYTLARFTTAFSGKTTTDLTEGSNLYYTGARWAAAFAAENTDGLAEGSINLYFTPERVQDVVGAFVTDNSTVHWSYIDPSNTLEAIVQPNSTQQKVGASKNSILQSIRHELNFIEGSNVTLTVNDNSGNDRVDITIAAATGAISWPLNIPFGTLQLYSDSDTGLGFPSDGLINFFNNNVNTVALQPGGVEFFVPVTVTNVVYPVKNANEFLAGPTTGSPAIPFFRTIVQGDISASAIPYPLQLPIGAGLVIKSDSDTGVETPSDGLINFYNNNVLTWEFQPGQTTTHVDLIVDGNITANNLPQVFATSRPLMTDPTTGLAIEWPGTNVNSDYGISAQLGVDITTTSNNNLYRYEEGLEISADAAINYNMSVYDFHYDRNQTNFDLDGDIALLNYGMNHEGGGNVNNFQFANFHQSLGTGPNAAKTDSLRGIEFNQFINLTAKAVDVRGYSYFFGSADANAVTQDYYAYGSFINNVDIARNADGYYMNFSPTTVGGGYRGFAIDSNSIVTGNVSGFSFNSNIATLGNFSGFQIGQNANIGGNFFGYGGGVSNGVNIGGDVNLIGMALGNGTIGGFLNGVNITSDSVLSNGANLFNGFWNGATAVNQVYGSNISFGSGSANSLIGYNFNINNGTASNQVAGYKFGGSGTGDQVQGFEANLNQFVQTGSGLKRTFIGTGGGTRFELDVHTNVTTIDIAESYHSFNATTYIEAGFPINGPFVFGNMIGHNLVFADNMDPDVFGGLLGYSMNSVFGQILGSATVDKVNFMQMAASLPAPFGSYTDGGTITEVNFARVLGLITQGGSLNVGSSYAFKVESTYDGTPATNLYGVYIDSSNAHNFFKRNVVVGGSAGSSNYTLDITGDSVFRGFIYSNATVTAAADFNNRVLINSASNTSLDWDLYLLKAADTTNVMNWDLRQTLDNTNAASVDWGARTLYDTNGTTVVATWGAATGIISFPVGALADEITVPGNTTQTYNWTNATSAPTPQTLITLPLNTYGSGTITEVLGTPDTWALINVGGVDYKIPLYL